MDSALMTNKFQPKKYRSYSQQELKRLSNLIYENIEDLLSTFNVDYRKTSKMLISTCPIHGGDNPSAFNLYLYGDDYKGHWKCRTHHCEEIFMPSMIGLVRGLLSHKEHGWSDDSDSMVSFNDTLIFIESFLKDKGNVETLEVEHEELNFIDVIDKLKTKKSIDNNEHIVTKIIPRSIVRKLLKIPAQYYIDRGYTKQILDKYDVGLCLTRGKEMYGRVVAPVYDENYTTMIGCTGRSIFNKCESCKAHHNESHRCPDKQNQWKYSKWKHSFGFKSQWSLYNYWFAKKYIKDSGVAILVESPGNVWRLEENGIHNSVAMFGSNLSDKQLALLDNMGCTTIVVLTDNDQAGEDAKKNIIHKCQKTHRIFSPIISKSDVGEMTSDEIHKEIIDYLRKIK